MGWSVHYRAVIDGVVSGADRDLLVEQTAKWTALLHEGSESYWWEPRSSTARMPPPNFAP